MGAGSGMLPGVRILVVEDERSLAAALQRGLRAEGFAVDVAWRIPAAGRADG